MRAISIFGGILLHTALCYMAYAPSWWYVINPKTSTFLTALVVLLDIPIMPALFFIAGYFALPRCSAVGRGGS